jgi:hypothetical protein
VYDEEAELEREDAKLEKAEAMRELVMEAINDEPLIEEELDPK